MICKVCGMEYAGDVCPKCKTPGTLDYTQYDYFPHRAQIRQTQFAAGGSAPLSGQEQPPRQEPAGMQNDRQRTGWNAEDRRPFGICPKCGNVLRGNFCGQCGYFAGNRRPGDQVNTGCQPNGWNGAGQQGNSFTENYRNSRQPLPPQPKPKTWVIVLVVLAFVFLVVILPILFVFGYTSFLVHMIDSLDKNYSLYSSGDGSSHNQYDESYEDFDDFMERYFNENGQNGEESATEQIPEDEGESVLPNGVSNQEYAQLAPGMTYAEISSIIGGDGVVITQDGDDFTAAWPGEYKPDAVVTVVFEDGLAKTIEQDGLF
jgi:hypothetical protein